MEVEKNIPKTISVMLDFSRTCTNINDETAQIFIKQLDILRLQFGADIATISVSTSTAKPESIMPVLDVLARHATENVVLGLNFLYSGTYDYETKSYDIYGFAFNSKKIAVFDKYYVSNPEYDNQWFALIDDSLNEYVYEEYRETHPMFICKPTQERNKENFMSYETETANIEGVIEGLDHYIESIKGMTKEEVLERQKYVFSSSELQQKADNGEYATLLQFFNSDFATDEHCLAILGFLRMKSNHGELTKEELLKFQDILDAIARYYLKMEDERGLSRINFIKTWTEDY